MYKMKISQMSHISQRIFTISMILIIISIISICCDLRELRDFRFIFKRDKSLQVTAILTEPNIPESYSQTERSVLTLPTDSDR
jgi:hypothetical protein